MPSNIRTARRMLRYARRNGLRWQKPKTGKPICSTLSPVWGRGKRTLAWRVSAHAFGDNHASTQKTERLVKLLFPPSLGQRIVRAAAGEVGVTEHPAASNDGPRVRAYQSVTGMYRQPWCASFVCWAYRKAGYGGQFAPLAAYVPSWTAMIARGERGWERVAFEDAKAGDVVTLWSSGHVEIVAGREGEYLRCIGGNTSPVGKNSNGGMVALTKRHRSEVTVIGRPA